MILHPRLTALPLGLTLLALTAAPAAAQAPSGQPGAIEAVAGAQGLAGGVLGGVGATLQSPPPPVGGVVDALPAVGGTLEEVGSALQPAESSQPGTGVPSPPAPPGEQPAPTDPPTGQSPAPAGEPPGGTTGGINGELEAAAQRGEAPASWDSDRGTGGGSAPVEAAHASAPLTAAAALAAAAGGGSEDGSGGVLSVPPPRAREAGAFERIVSVVPWPVYAALALMGTLLALSTLRSQRYRRRLREAETAAKTDGLTGLPNRQDAERFLERVVAGSARSGRQLSIALVDLDHFKAINDDFGHAAGDATLRGVAHALRSELRTADHVGRLGGEEFLAILPDAGTEEALAVAERIRERIAAMPRRVDRRVTASIGVATLPGDACSATDLTAAADRALYAAKEAGRDRVVWAGALKSPGRTAAVNS